MEQMHDVSKCIYTYILNKKVKHTKLYLNYQINYDFYCHEEFAYSYSLHNFRISGIMPNFVFFFCIFL